MISRKKNAKPIAPYAEFTGLCMKTSTSLFPDPALSQKSALNDLSKDRHVYAQA